MPTISLFYGVIISMYYNDHNPPHIHAKYQGQKAVFNLNGDITEGTLPTKQTKLIAAWIEIHKESIMANWELARTNKPLHAIDPLR